jgi:hypothetical protein
LISESNYRHARESGYRDHERLIFIVGLCVMTVVLHVDERHFGEIRHAPREQDADDAVPLAKPIQGFNGLLVRQTIRFGGPSGPKTAGPAVGGPVEFSTCRATPQQETAGSRPSGNRRRYGCRGTPMPYPKFIQPSYDQAGAVEQVELVLFAAIDPEGFRPAKIVGLAFHLPSRRRDPAATGSPGAPRSARRCRS